MAKVMISLPDDFLKKVDRAARAEGRSRSELIREALRSAVAKKRARSWKQALAPLRQLEERWLAQWDSTDIIRYYRDRRYGGEDRR
ncbi:MAG TPA: ribbon-helix-helix protein, CopG family [Verrucomicrobiae bacterium]|jgi:CopG family transcriptional regulator / antitoxin EndoAI|nr:ribbon-helix-helix protein, CopG family [Verrucomicrobiae bacterium]